MNLWLAIAPLVVAGLVSLLAREQPLKHWGAWLALVPLFSFLVLCYDGLQLHRNGPIEQTVLLYPSIGFALDLRLDGLSLILALLITGIGSLIVLYAWGYMGKEARSTRFFGYLLLFAASMLGIVLANNILLLFIFWEGTSIFSWLLIGHNHTSKQARWNALQALLITGLGGGLMLAGLILLTQMAGSFLISDLTASGELIRQHPQYPLALLLILAGALTKSAQFPFSFWLPNAMAGPTPVSAYLHSATMVKAGIYLLLRLSPCMNGTELWTSLITTSGLITMLTGAILGILQTDLKTVLAYTTLSVLGILTMLIGLGTEACLQAALIFLIGHALYKATLFMAVGSIDHETGTREISLLGGLSRAMPFTAAAAAMAAFSSAGFPPFLGFMGKEYIYKAGLKIDLYSEIILAIAVLTNMLLLALSLKAGLHPFFSKQPCQTPKPPHEAPFSMLLGPMLLGFLGLSIGLFPGFVELRLLEPAMSELLQKKVQLTIALWHGFNIPLLLSVATLLGGFLIYNSRRFFWKQQGARDFSFRFSPARIYDSTYQAILDLAQWQMATLQNGVLRNYLMVILGTTFSLVAWKLLISKSLPLHLSFHTITLLDGAILLSIVAGTLVAVLSRSRMTALLALGLLGFGVAMIFLTFGAPDLAITQVLVETLAVVLFMFVVYRFPPLNLKIQVNRKLADLAFSIVIGGTVTLLVLKAQSLQLEHPISDQLGRWSYLEAMGKNVVNVILVDFRALDTLGEITVLLVAALGVVLLLTAMRNTEPPKNQP